MPGEASFRGQLTVGADTIRDSHIKTSADIGVDKMRHAYAPGTSFGLAIGATPTTREEIVHVANAVGEVRGFHAMLNETGSSTSIAFDLKKNGVSILSAPITVAHTDTDREIIDGTISAGTLAAGDVLSIEMTVSSSTGAQGPRAWCSLEERTAPN